MISAIVAMGKNRVIGRKNGLLWPIPDDLKRFKKLTMGHPIVMGRKTYESIGKPLPGRASIVITREPNAKREFIPHTANESVIFVSSIEEALKKAEETGAKEIFVIGGAQIYEQALPFIDRLYVTLVDSDEEGDAYFPPYEKMFTKKLSEEPRESNGLRYRWVTLEK